MIRLEHPRPGGMWAGSEPRLEARVTRDGDKFELLRYGDNAEIKSETQYTSNTGLVIKEEDQVRDLGVTMHSSGSFSPQIQKLVAEGRKQCGWILRTFNTRDTLPMLTLWKSLVMSRLEYCSQLWCPLKKGEIQALEMVQRTFLRKITRMSELSYWEQLKKLNMYSLERRRERYRIIYVWKVLENLVPNIGNDIIRSKTHQRRGRECFPPKQSATLRGWLKRRFFTVVCIQ